MFKSAALICGALTVFRGLHMLISLQYGVSIDEVCTYLYVQKIDRGHFWIITVCNSSCYITCAVT